MLKYLRNKVVSVDLDPPGRLCVHGILDDDLYGIEMDAVFGLDELEIQSVSGKWHRYTTPACPLALDHLEEVVGIRVEPGYRARLQKGLGRTGCRHFAGLLTEMGHAARTAALVIGYRQARGDDPDLTMDAFQRQASAGGSIEKKAAAEAPPPPQPDTEVIETPPAAGPTAQPRGQARPSGGCVIDLHVHTSPASPCSSISVDDLIAEAQQIGLDGLVLSDHNHVWSRAGIEDLRQKHGFLVLGGNEIITDQGDVLVYGLDRDIEGVIPLADLRGEVQKAGGFMAMAHPFRGFLIFGAQQLGLTVEKAARREMFKYVDAIEVLNGKVTPDENDFARRVAASLNIPGVAGSDAHEAGSVGTYATEFSSKIENEKDLVQALFQGDYRPVAFR
jgi:predicted metal-dependent phosphoesterase TrpH